MLKQTFELPQLESHLWESANILRGSVDAADFYGNAHSDFHDEADFSRLLGIATILANGANLSIPLYVKRPSGKSVGDADSQLATLPVAWEQRPVASQPFGQQMDSLVDILDGFAYQESST